MITFPKNKIQYEIDTRMKSEEQTNISAFMLDCLEKNWDTGKNKWIVAPIKRSTDLPEFPADGAV